MHFPQFVIFAYLQRFWQLGKVVRVAKKKAISKEQAEKAINRLFVKGEINRKIISGDPLGPPPVPGKKRKGGK